jgi:hypothetical protein
MGPIFAVVLHHVNDFKGKLPFAIFYSTTPHLLWTIYFYIYYLLLASLMRCAASFTRPTTQRISPCGLKRAFTTNKTGQCEQFYRAHTEGKFSFFSPNDGGIFDFSSVVYF